MADYIKAIETVYKGHRMRSRLEARWAVFLDAMEITWEYEKQGFDVNGTWYLPDFWVPYEASFNPGWGFHVEIKPTRLTKEETDLLAELARLSGHMVFAICGSPWPKEYKVLVFQHHHNGVPESIPLCDDGMIEEEVTSFSFGDGYSLGKYKLNLFSVEGKNTRFLPSMLEYCTWDVEFRLQKAFLAARGARWEHGEQPKV